MSLILIEHPDHPPTFYKDVTPEIAKEKWLKGFTQEDSEEARRDVTAREINLNEFLKHCPDDGFQVIEDSGS